MRVKRARTTIVVSERLFAVNKPPPPPGGGVRDVGDRSDSDDIANDHTPGWTACVCVRHEPKLWNPVACSPPVPPQHTTNTSLGSVAR